MEGSEKAADETKGHSVIFQALEQWEELREEKHKGTEKKKQAEADFKTSRSLWDRL